MPLGQRAQCGGMRQDRQIMPVERCSASEIRDVNERSHGARQLDPLCGQL